MNAGFHDSEALLAQPHELTDHTPLTVENEPTSTSAALLMVAHEGDEVESEVAGIAATSASLDASTTPDNADFRLSCVAVPHVESLMDYHPSDQ